MSETMTIIDSKTPGVLSLGDDFTGKIVVRAATSLMPRYQARKLQLVRATGGSGCIRGKLGSGVFVMPLYIETKDGSGMLRATTEEDAEFEGYKMRLGSVLGVASDELVAEVAGDPDTIEPGDPKDLCVMAIKDGEYAKADTVAAALKMLGKRRIAGITVIVCHREAGINDMGFLTCPRAFMVEGRPMAQNVSGCDDGITRTLPAAEEYAAHLIAKARA